MIVVTGMHRSGTSLIANLLMELGVPFSDPAEFLGADEWNAKGYFEASDILDTNSRIVSGFPYCQGGWIRTASQIVYATHPGPAALKRRFRGLRADVDALFAKYRGVAVKDPRFCLTLGLWHAVEPIEQLVVCLRHPREAVLSLVRRQSYPASLGYRYWNYHLRSLLEALEHLGSTEVVFLDYNRLSSGEHRAELAAIRAAFSLPIEPAAAATVYEKVFEPSLRHIDAGDADLPSATRRLWTELCRRRDASLATHAT